MCPQRNLPRLKQCMKGTPAARISRWRSTLRNGYIFSVNNTTVSTVEDATKEIEKAVCTHSDLTIIFGTLEKSSLHPQNGTPMIYFDQLRLIGQHLHDIKEVEWLCNEHSYEASRVHSMAPIQLKNKSNKNKLTRRKLQKLPESEWIQWRDSEFLQLDQYEQQGTFGEPQPRPMGCNCLPLLWTYLIKDDDRKKARCNGSPSKKGTVTLGHTYASSLDHNGSRIFGLLQHSATFGSMEQMCQTHLLRLHLLLRHCLFILTSNIFNGGKVRAALQFQRTMCCLFEELCRDIPKAQGCGQH